eukprot:scaffold388_cov244-Pinguiococcus_pyrenoidosus.AAC.2
MLRIVGVARSGLRVPEPHLLSPRRRRRGGHGRLRLLRFALAQPRPLRFVKAALRQATAIARPLQPRLVGLVLRRTAPLRAAGAVPTGRLVQASALALAQRRQQLRQLQRGGWLPAAGHAR